MAFFLGTDSKTLAFSSAGSSQSPAMSLASSVCCLSESVNLDSPKPSLHVGSVAMGKILQSLQYLGRNHCLRLGHILFQQQLNVAIYLARISAVYHRFTSELIQTSFAIFGTLRSTFSSGDEAFSSITE